MSAPPVWRSPRAKPTPAGLWRGIPGPRRSAGCRPLRNARGRKKRAGPWGGDGPARGGVSTITLRKGECVHRRRTTTLRSRPATRWCVRNASFKGFVWLKRSRFPGKQAVCGEIKRICTPSAATRPAEPRVPPMGDPVANARLTHPPTGSRHRAAPSTARYRPRDFACANYLGLNLREPRCAYESPGITMWKLRGDGR